MYIVAPLFFYVQKNVYAIRVRLRSQVVETILGVSSFACLLNYVEWLSCVHRRYWIVSPIRDSLLSSPLMSMEFVAAQEEEAPFVLLRTKTHKSGFVDGVVEWVWKYFAPLLTESVAYF